MSFADLASLGSFVSGIGVLVSLIYLSLQIRQNTRAVRSQIHQHIADSWLSLGVLLADHSREFTAALKAGEKVFADKPDDEKFAFLVCIFVFFKHFENMYLQYQEGLIARENWDAWTSQMFMYWHMPAVQTFWKSRRLTFSPEFRRFIEESPESSIPSTLELFAQAGDKNAPPPA